KRSPTLLSSLKATPDSHDWTMPRRRLRYCSFLHLLLRSLLHVLLLVGVITAQTDETVSRDRSSDPVDMGHDLPKDIVSKFLPKELPEYLLDPLDFLSAEQYQRILSLLQSHAAEARSH